MLFFIKSSHYEAYNCSLIRPKLQLINTATRFTKLNFGACIECHLMKAMLRTVIGNIPNRMEIRHIFATDWLHVFMNRTSFGLSWVPTALRCIMNVLVHRNPNDDDNLQHILHVLCLLTRFSKKKETNSIWNKHYDRVGRRDQARLCGRAERILNSK